MGKFGDSLSGNRVAPAACIQVDNLADNWADNRAVLPDILVGSLAGTPVVALVAAWAGAGMAE